MQYNPSNCQEVLLHHKHNILFLDNNEVLTDSLIHFAKKYGTNPDNLFAQSDVVVSNKPTTEPTEQIHFFKAKTCKGFDRFPVIINISSITNNQAFVKNWLTTYNQLLGTSYEINQNLYPFIHNLFILEHTLNLLSWQLTTQEIIRVLKAYKPIKPTINYSSLEMIYALKTEKIKLQK